MKTFTLTTALYLLSTFFCSATSYYTLADGSWSDPMIWSTDGVSNCFCVPSAVTTASSIDINHAIVGTNDIFINTGTKINVAPSASFFAPYNDLTINMGELSADNDIRFRKVTINVGTTLNLSNALLFTYGTVTVGGTLNLDNAEVFMLLGNWNVELTGTVNMINNSIAHVTTGNYENFGTTFVETGSMLSNCGGNLRNYTGAAFTGGGDVYAISLIRNYKGGNWDAGLRYCAGSTIGLPGAPDCSIAPSDCYIVPLSVSLLSFDGEGNNGVNELEWVIGSEVSVKSYVLEKSIDGKSWEFITEINAVGSENVSKTYNYEDANVTAEVSYYRLAVKDEENNTVKENFISVTNRMNGEVTVYPNPFTTSCKLNFGDSDYSSVEIMDLTGKIIFESNVIGKSFELSIDQPAGVYLLKLKGQDEKIIRLIKK